MHGLLKACVGVWLIAVMGQRAFAGDQTAKSPDPTHLWMLIHLNKDGIKAYALDTDSGARKDLAVGMQSIHKGKAELDKLVAELDGLTKAQPRDEAKIKDKKALIETQAGNLDSSVEAVIAELKKVDTELDSDTAGPTGHGLVEPGRWLQEKGAKIFVLCIASLKEIGGTDVKVELKIKEKQRDSQFVSDMKKLIAALAPDGFTTSDVKPVDESKPPRFFVAEQSRTLQETRASVTVTAKIVSPAPSGGAAPAPAATASASTDPDPFAQVIRTGTREVLYLSLDIPFKDVTVTQDIHAGAKKKPESLLVGLNWMLGAHADLGAADASPSSLVFKIFAKPSGNPLDQFGAGLGWRCGGGFFGGLTINAGWEWNREERTATGGGRTFAYPGQFVCGVGFNMDKAVSWLKK